MTKPNSIWILIAVTVLAVSAFVGYKLVSSAKKPLGESAQIQFPKSEKSKIEIENLFSGEFRPIERVELFPEPIRKLYREIGGARYTMANPGKRYSTTDAIDDSSLPMRRLIVGGTAGDRCFIHYEHGGIARSSEIAFFKIGSDGPAEAVWLGFCGDYDQPAKDVESLRRLISQGYCMDSNSRPAGRTN